MRLFHSAALALAVALAGCAATTQTSAPPETSVAQVDPLAHPDRPTADRENDARRKAQETLAFFGARPGQTIVDLEAGSGYWTEILARAVGPEGSVVMQNPAVFMSFAGDDIRARLANDRLPNVRLSLTPFDALDAPDASADLVTWVQGPHELYYHPNGASFGDVAKTYAEIYRVLKPGGVFAVVDHSAPAGAPETTGNDTHRIDPAIVIQAAQAAGLRLEARGDFLANPEDPRTASVFDPSIRGRTDQFALRFRKPA